MKKTSTEPPLAQSSKCARSTLNHTAPNLVICNPVTPSQINTSSISKSPQVRFLTCRSSHNYFPVHQPAVTNSMQLQSSCTHIYRIYNQRCISNPVEQFFWGNSQCVKAIGYFHRRAPLWIFDRIFDRILNATLPKTYYS